MSDQARTAAGDQAAAFQQAVYASKGRIGSTRGGARPQGYADPQVAYESAGDFVAGADQD